ncbi:aspartate aminotransferase family protein [Oligosphaera ethanolica]|uniref:4-aminobutyrate aminotransferase-like enzyme n=1 Tax=Oligosphaera ethanolica TaxID=760260 RepID=A0AAE3VG86_9BACT|nr:aspartate aminotransferase family protein [Oligosphaera ethanolica]MDQ0289815.1 4-aminobutyrate aminotransferase-like enzyme [Oligosphaera ethanolica]
MGKYNPAPYQLDLNRIPHLITESIPGPKSNAMHARAVKHYRGLSGQVKLFPVAFERGEGCMLEDIDGNQFIDFSSGIYVTTLGHCHPKISEGIAKYAHQLMNAHDFTTEIKTRLLEKMAATLPGDLKCFQLYDCGTAAVEAGLRTCRAATGKHEFISCFMDFHGKSGHSIGLARMTKFSGPTREPGFYLVPRPDTYRPLWNRPDGSLDTEKYLEFYDQFIRESTTNQIAAFVAEPIQGWAGSIMPPDDFFPKLKKFLEERDILFFADEVLTSMGRTGKILCCEHWNVLPDVVTLGKGFGNGFPVTAMAVREPFADAVDKISASTSYGGNPMACAAALACFEVIEEEGLLEHAQELEELFRKRMADWTQKYKIVGDCRVKGCLMGVELVKDQATKEPFDAAGKLVYQKAFRKGLAWIPAGHILRMSPPIVMPNEVAQRGMDFIEEAIAETEKELLG